MAQPTDPPSSAVSGERPKSADPSGQQESRPSGGGGAVASLLALARDHPAPVLAGLSSAVAVARVLTISNFDTTTALALLSGGAGPTLVLGSILGLLPFGVLALAAMAWLRRTDVTDGQRSLLDVLFIFAVGLSVLLVPIWFALIAAGLVAFLSFQRRRSRELHESERGSITDPNFVAVPIVLMVVFSALSPGNVWLAPERLTLVGGNGFVGYVTTTATPWTQVLQQSPRIVLMLKSDDIATRTYCREADSLISATVLDVIANVGGFPEPVPDCDDAS